MAESTHNWSRREIALGVALFAVLIALAVLQYRWIGQVSEAERLRLDRDLRTSMARFVEEFDGELQRLVRFMVAGGASRVDPAQRLAVWRDTTRYPSIVARVEPRTTEELPDELRTLIARAPAFGGRGGGQGGVGAPPVVDPEKPSIAVPMTGPDADGRWLLIEFDRDAITKTWLPDLVARHFGSDYHVEVLGPRGVIYRSDDQTVPANDEEGMGGLFALRGGYSRGRGRGPAPPPNGPPPEGGPPPDLAPSGAPPEPPPDGFPRDGRGADFANAPPFVRNGRGGPGEARWRVIAAYKGGTIDERVAAIRTRNLAVSFGMLLLMGVSVGMLLLSSRRARLLARQQMEFVAGVTHELRTPLAVISSASQNLADGVTTGAEQTRRYGGVIRDQGKRLSDMVEQILRFAGLASERAEMRRQPVDVAEVIDQAVADCQPDLAASGSELVREVPADLPAVSGDPGSLAHCLRNLLSNAVKHGEGAPVRLEAVAVDGTVEIRVEDHGPGIDPADLPHIFDPFYRGRRATSEQIQGTGLGLSLVKKIAEAHDGSVEVTSRPGHGAKFVVRLPAAKEDS